VGPSDLRGEPMAGALTVLATFPFRGLPFAWIKFFRVSEEPDAELDSSTDVGLPEDSESRSLSSELLMEGRVWLDPVERDSGAGEGPALSTPITSAFGVGVFSPVSESLPASDEDSEESESLDFNLAETAMVIPLASVAFDVEPGILFVASSSSDSPDSESDPELDSLELEPESSEAGVKATIGIRAF